MIKNLVFDFGGVLLDLRPDRCIDQFCAIGIPKIKDLLGLAHQQGPLGDLERGELTLKQFCNEMRAFCDAEQTVLPTDRQIVQAFCSMADGIPAYRLDFLQTLKDEGFSVSALSNTNTAHWGYCQRYFIECGYVPEELFEHLWLSCEMGLSKPDPAIFRAILEDSGYLPGETLFIDDNAENCRIAETCGIHSLCVPIRSDWSQQLREKLRSIL